MLIVTSLAAALAGSLAGVAPLTAALPPVAVTVDVAVDLPPLVVSVALQEADAIWNPTGITFAWRVAPRATLNPADPCPPASTLRVVIGDARGSAPPDQTPIAWIVFDEDGMPARDLYVSHKNALEFLMNASGGVPRIGQMTRMEENLRLGRAMGRALAHELGHYLLASKAHARRGLMQASHTAYSFFDVDRSSFAIDKVMRQELAARLRHEPLTASSRPSP